MQVGTFYADLGKWPIKNSAVMNSPNAETDDYPRQMGSIRSLYDGQEFRAGEGRLEHKHLLKRIIYKT